MNRYPPGFIPVRVFRTLRITAMLFLVCFFYERTVYGFLETDEEWMFTPVGVIEVYDPVEGLLTCVGNLTVHFEANSTGGTYGAIHYTPDTPLLPDVIIGDGVIDSVTLEGDQITISFDDDFIFTGILDDEAGTMAGKFCEECDTSFGERLSTNSISGTVYESDGTTPIPNISVEVYAGVPNANFPYNCVPSLIDSADTDINGQYLIHLPAGDYFVLATNIDSFAGGWDGRPLSNGDELTYMPEWYDGVPFSYDGLNCNMPPVSVAVGANTPDIDFQLDRMGFISGIVTDTSEMPVTNIRVSAVREEFSTGCRHSYLNIGVYTNESGEYKIYLSPADYYVMACGDCTGLGYKDEWYDDIEPETGECVMLTSPPVSVVLVENTGNINFQLDKKVNAMPWIPLLLLDDQGTDYSEEWVFSIRIEGYDVVGESSVHLEENNTGGSIGYVDLDDIYNMLGFPDFSFGDGVIDWVTIDGDQITICVDELYVFTGILDDEAGTIISGEIYTDEVLTHTFTGTRVSTTPDE